MEYHLELIPIEVVLMVANIALLIVEKLGVVSALTLGHPTPHSNITINYSEKLLELAENIQILISNV